MLKTEREKIRSDARKKLKSMSMPSYFAKSIIVTFNIIDVNNGVEKIDMVLNSISVKELVKYLINRYL